MVLTQIHSGVYSLEGVPQISKVDVVVAVHPFFLGKYNLNAKVGYVSKLNKFIFSKKGLIITLEQASSFEQTAEYYTSLGQKKNRLFFKTLERDNETLDVSWGQFSRIVNYYRGKNSVKLIGGIFNGNLHNFNGGCLDSTAYRFKRDGIPFKIIEDLTFN